MISVLFVEDDLDQINLYRYAFEKQGMKLLPAVGAADTIDTALNAQPDVILLDLLLEDEYGIDILKDLKDHPMLKDIPVIVFTNFESLESRDRARAFHATDYVIKSQVTPKEMIERVRAIVADREKSKADSKGSSV